MTGGHLQGYQYLNSHITIRVPEVYISSYVLRLAPCFRAVCTFDHIIIFNTVQ